MQNMITMNTCADVMSVYKQALLDDRLAKQLTALRGDEAIKAQGPCEVAKYAVAWAAQALDEAVAAGAVNHYHPNCVLALANAAISDMIIDGGVL